MRQTDPGVVRYDRICSMGVREHCGLHEKRGSIWVLRVCWGERSGGGGNYHDRIALGLARRLAKRWLRNVSAADWEGGVAATDGGGSTHSARRSFPT